MFTCKHEQDCKIRYLFDNDVIVWQEDKSMGEETEARPTTEGEPQCD